jgi:hypothetical protein
MDVHPMSSSTKFVLLQFYGLVIGFIEHLTGHNYK